MPVEFLSTEELEAIHDPREIYDKAQQCIVALQAELETEKAHRNSEKVNHDHLVHKLEQDYLTLQLEFEKSAQQNTKIKKDFENTVSAQEIVSREMQALKNLVHEKEATLTRLSRATEELHQEKREMLELIERRNKEVESLNAELKGSMGRLLDIVAAKSEMQTLISELESQKTTSEFQIQRLQQEKDALEKHNAWLYEQLTTKSEELVTFKTQKNAFIFELQNEKEHLEEQVAKLQYDVNTHKSQVQAYEQLLADQTRQLKVLNNDKEAIEERLRSELDAQAKLASLYKESAESATRRCSHLQSEVDALRELNKATEGALEIEREARREASTESSKFRDMSTNVAVQGLSPPTTPNHPGIPEIALRRINATVEHGTREDIKKELLDMMAQYDDVIKLLLQERSERRRLGANLHQILQELQTKAPVIDNQRKEYEKMKKIHAALSSNLETALNKFNVQSAELERVLSENSRLKTDIAGLNTQIQVLLRESLGKSGNQIPAEDPADLCVGEEVIPARILTFRTVEELQIRNFELTRAVRSLTEQVNDRRQEFEDKRLQEAIKELDHLRTARASHEEVVRVLLAQHGAYQKLSVLSDKQSPQQTRDEMATTVSLSDSEATRLYIELKEEFEHYKREKQISEEELHKQLTEARHVASTSRIELSKSQSEVALLAQRQRMTVSSLEASTKDNVLLRQKVQECTSLLVAHQQTIGELRTSNAQMEERVRSAQVALELVRDEQKLVKEANNRLLEEKQSLLVDRGRAQALVDQVQSLSLAKDAASQALRERLESELTTLRMDWTQNKKMLEEVQRVSRDISSSLEAQLRELRATTAERDKEIRELREESIRRAGNEEGLKQQISSLKATLEVSEARLGTVLQTAAAQHDSGNVSALTLELELARTDLTNANEALTQERDNATRYKAMARDYEADVKMLRESADKLQLELDERLKALQDEKDNTSSRIAELEGELANIKEAHETRTRDMQQRLDEVGPRLQEQAALLERVQVLEERHKSMLGDIEAHSKAAQVAQANYSHELIAHAQDMKLLEELKEKLMISQAELEKGQVALDNTKSGFDAKESSWHEQLLLIQQHNAELESKITDLKQQNEVLHTHAEVMASQAQHFQKEYIEQRTSESLDNIAASVTMEQEKAMTSLREVARFLRQENVLLEVKVEALRQESLRYRQQAEHATKALDNARLQLHEEQERARAALQTEGEHRQLLQQVEQLNLLRESNIVLRDESARSSLQLNEARSRIAQLEVQLKPLQSSTTQLEAEVGQLRDEIAARDEEIRAHRARIQKLLDKYQSVDPELHHHLVEEHEALKARVEAADKTVEEVQAKHLKLKRAATRMQEDVAKKDIERAELLQKIALLEKEKHDIAQTLYGLEKDKQGILLKVTSLEKETNELVQKVAALEKEKLQLAEESQNDRKRLRKAAQVNTTLKEENTRLSQDIEELKKAKEDLDMRLKVFEAKTRSKILPHSALTLVPPATATAITPTPTPTPIIAPSTDTTTPPLAPATTDSADASAITTLAAAGIATDLSSTTPAGTAEFPEDAEGVEELSLEEAEEINGLETEQDEKDGMMSSEPNPLPSPEIIPTENPQIPPQGSMFEELEMPQPKRQRASHTDAFLESIAPALFESPGRYLAPQPQDNEQKSDSELFTDETDAIPERLQDTAVTEVGITSIQPQMAAPEEKIPSLIDVTTPESTPATVSPTLLLPSVTPKPGTGRRLVLGGKGTRSIPTSLHQTPSTSPATTTTPSSSANRGARGLKRPTPGGIIRLTTTNTKQPKQTPPQSTTTTTTSSIPPNTTIPQNSE